jgi:hypothetical protein
MLDASNRLRLLEARLASPRRDFTDSEKYFFSEASRVSSVAIDTPALRREFAGCDVEQLVGDVRTDI